MRKFLKQVFILALPLLLLFALVVYVDPYSLYHSNRDFDQIKYDITYSFDQGRRFKIIDFLNHPSSNIILGASEINTINKTNIPEQDWQSLSFGGAPLDESIDLFWKIVSQYKIKTLIIAPEFIKYYNACLGDYYVWNSSQSAMAYELYSNKLEYLIDKNVIKSTFYCLFNRFGLNSSKNKPKMSKQEFWNHQLNYAKGQFDQPVQLKSIENVKDRISKVADFCTINGIDVKIVLPIQHADLINLEYSEKTYPLYRDYLEFLISAFGSIYYFDYPNKISVDNELFSDPFHYLSGDIYINAIWDNNITNCIILQKESDIFTVDSIRSTFLQYE